MAEVTIRTNLECSADDYWKKCLFDETYNTKLYADVLRFPGAKMLELSTEGAVWRRRLHIDPPVTGLPGPVAKLLGDAFSYTEDGSFDTATKRYTFTVTPSVAADKTKTSGESWCETAVDGKTTTLVTRLRVEVKIFMVGGLVEEKILKDFRVSLDQAAPFITQHTK
jgi:Protein of unknown function (DUF2505)